MIDIPEMLAEYKMRFGSSKGFVDRLPHTTLETDLYRDVRVMAHRIQALEAVLAAADNLVNGIYPASMSEAPKHRAAREQTLREAIAKAGDRNE